MDIKKISKLIKKKGQVASYPDAPYSADPLSSEQPKSSDDLSFDDKTDYTKIKPSTDKQYDPNFNGPQQSSFNAVKNLQQSIINFAAAASATDITSMQGNQQGKQEGNQELETPNPNFDDTKPVSPENPKTIKNKEYLGGSDAFGKFLVK